MTDSIKIYFPSEKLPKVIHEKIPYKLRLEGDRHDQAVPPRVSAKEQYPKSPLTREGYELKVNILADGALLGISASVNVPACIVGQNAEHGTSVLAAADASLLLVKSFLATHGVPRSELEKLCHDDVDINQVTLTFLIPTDSAKKSLELVCKALGILHPKQKTKKGKFAEGFRYLGDAQDNVTVYCNKREFGLSIYAKSPDRVSTDLQEFTASHIRIELILHGAELEHRGWNKPASWVGAHESGRYAAIFREYVQEAMFRLHENLREVRPDVTDVAKLSGLALKVFNGYAAGRDPRTASEFRELLPLKRRAEQQRFSKVKGEIFKALRIDITIPFEQHIQLKMSKLRKLLVWESDHHPANEIEDRCFCKAAWPQQKARLEQAITDACAKHLERQSERTKVDGETGEITQIA